MNRLIDRFGREHTYLRISVTDRCNLRCRYCMPEEGIKLRGKDEILSFEEICRLAEIFAHMGVTKIRITGGEPLVRANIERLLQMLAPLKSVNGGGISTLAMTTNATLLADKVEVLRSAGLDVLNISLDTFRAERFKELTRRDELARVLAGLEAALKARFPVLKLNTVVIRNFNDDEIMDFVEYARDNPVNVRFIEYMPFPDNEWTSAGVVPFAEMRQKIESRYALIPLNNPSFDVARDFAIEGFPGRVSFITSMSESFCSTCNRIRLTADGFVKSCLFYDGEINLKDALAAGADRTRLEELITQALWMKPEAHPPAEELAGEQNRHMVAIGG